MCNTNTNISATVPIPGIEMLHAKVIEISHCSGIRYVWSYRTDP